MEDTEKNNPPVSVDKHEEIELLISKIAPTVMDSIHEALNIGKQGFGSR